MEPPKFAIGIGLKKVSNHWCMIKVDDNMEMVDKPLPLFYETDGLYSPISVRSCSSIDGLAMGHIQRYGCGRSHVDGAG